MTMIWPVAGQFTSPIRKTLAGLSFASIVVAGTSAQAQTLSCASLISKQGQVQEGYAKIDPELRKANESRFAQSRKQLEKLIPMLERKLTRLESLRLYMMNFAIKRMIRIRAPEGYPWTYTKDGTMQRIRYLIKRGVRQGDPLSEEIYNEVLEMFDRYESYKSDLKREIDRTVMVHEEVKILTQALAKKNQKYPLTLQIPKYTEFKPSPEGNGTIPEAQYVDLRLNSRDQLVQVLESTKRKHFYRFDGIWSNNLSKGRFMLGRETEQAEYLVLLRSILEDYRIFSRGALKPKLSEIIDRARSLFENEELRPSARALVEQYRKMFRDELSFFAGTDREFTDFGMEMNRHMRRNDKHSLGLDLLRLSSINELTRYTMVKVVPTLLTAGAAYLAGSTIWNTASQYASIYLREGAAIHSVATAPTEQAYQERTVEFLKIRYGLKFENGKPVLDEGAAEAVADIKKLREEFLADQNKKNTEIVSLAKFLSSDPRTISLRDFTSIVGSPDGAQFFQKVEEILRGHFKTDLSNLPNLKELVKWLSTDVPLNPESPVGVDIAPIEAALQSFSVSAREFLVDIREARSKFLSRKQSEPNSALILTDLYLEYKEGR